MDLSFAVIIVITGIDFGTLFVLVPWLAINDLEGG
jgi:hypothetical protein